ncbi:MAG: phytanoyl-CoA dioxygenase family protein [Pseudomonadota bacterium]
MNAGNAVRMPLFAAAILSGQKSFSNNPVIGSRRLNRLGLHRWRVQSAAAATARRRAALAPQLRPEERAAFDRDGFVVRENALPQELHARLVEELETVPRPAWEMRQGHAITRLMPLPTGRDGSAAAQARLFLLSPEIRALVGYVAGRAGCYHPTIQTIANRPDPDRPDPQNTLHADTFHATAKFWLFLHDVGADEGPFCYAAGSHVLTPERLAWEHEQSILATEANNAHHASGSFRLEEGDLEALGYGKAASVPVKANTLVVADTFGFHRRTPTTKPTVRTELHAMLRRNPFVPWNGGDVAEIPPIRDRLQALHFGYRDFKTRRGKPDKYRNVGERFAADPAD